MSLPPNTSFERVPIPAHQAVPRAAVPKKTDSAVSASPGVGSATTADKGAGSREFSFWDLVDIINPLQHIPVVSTIYRKVTGDEIGNFARIAGGGLYGGLIGAAAGGINAIVVTETGQDIGEKIYSALLGDETDKPTPPVATAAELPAPAVASRTEALHQGTSGTLFDSAAKASGPASKDPVETKRPIPVIEVHPIRKEALPQAQLPVAEQVSALPDFMTQSPAQDKITNAKDKAAIQRAMLDALLKMQELDKDGGEQAAAADPMDSLD